MTSGLRLLTGPDRRWVQQPEQDPDCAACASPTRTWNGRLGGTGETHELALRRHLRAKYR